MTRIDIEFSVGVPTNFSEPPKILQSLSGYLAYYLLDFFDIFGNHYAPEAKIICPYSGEMLERRGIRFDGSHSLMYVNDIFAQKWCHNITANLSEAAVKAFQQHAKKTFDDYNKHGSSQFFNISKHTATETANCTL